MVKATVFRIEVSNQHVPIGGLGESSHPPPRFHFGSLKDDWAIRHYTFVYASDSRLYKLPDISLIAGGALVFRLGIQKKLFPMLPSGLELLPIKVDGEDWLLLNCLNNTVNYDREESVAYRGLDGNIFFIAHFCSNDLSLVSKELFVISDSNRSTILAVEDFAKRVLSIAAGGLTFREIGAVKV